jgi:hypothetical protein
MNRRINVERSFYLLPAFHCADQTQRQDLTSCETLRNGGGTSMVEFLVWWLIVTVLVGGVLALWMGRK